LGMVKRLVLKFHFPGSLKLGGGLILIRGRSSGRYRKGRKQSQKLTVQKIKTKYYRSITLKSKLKDLHKRNCPKVNHRKEGAAEGGRGQSMFRHLK